MVRKAVIEIGTNSIKFCIAEKTADGSIVFIKDVSRITKLGAGMGGSGEISADRAELNAQTVACFAEEAKRAQAREIMVVGTMALRSASNASMFVKMVKEAAGVEVRILSGEEEAALSYDAVVRSIEGADGPVLMFDTGGGSTEFVSGDGGAIIQIVSLGIGAVSVTERFFPDTPVPAESLKRAMSEIIGTLAGSGIRRDKDSLLVGTGGNVTAMASVKQGMVSYDREKTHGSCLTLTEVRNQIESYAAKTLFERRRIKGLDPERAEIILAGACIVEAIMLSFGFHELTVSDRGLRHGLMYRLFGLSARGPCC